MSKPKAAHGQRKREAIEQIRAFEKQKKLWGVKDLADELGISVAQSWSLVQSLAYSATLVRGKRTVVVEDSLMLSGEA